jgi:hypothetical protein
MNEETQQNSQTADIESADAGNGSERVRWQATAVLLVAVALVTCTSCLVGVLVARTLRPTFILAGPSSPPTPSTPTPYPTQTPYPTHTPVCAICEPCPPEATPYPTATPRPCTPCPPTVTPTGTRKPAALLPTSTPTSAEPTATATPEYLFRVGLTDFLPPPNCDTNWFPILEGRIVDAGDFRIKGLRVQGVNSSGLVAPPSEPSGEMAWSTPHGGPWQHRINFKYQLPGTYDGSTWTIFVIDENNRQASEPFVWTLDPDCHNPAFVQFISPISQ